MSQGREGYTLTYHPSPAPCRSCALQIHASDDDSALHGCYARAATVQLALAKLLRTSDLLHGEKGTALLHRFEPSRFRHSSLSMAMARFKENATQINRVGCKPFSYPFASGELL